MGNATDKHVDGALLGRGPAVPPDGGHLPTSALLSMKPVAFSFVRLLKGCLSLIVCGSVV